MKKALKGLLTVTAPIVTAMAMDFLKESREDYQRRRAARLAQEEESRGTA